MGKQLLAGKELLVVLAVLLFVLFQVPQVCSGTQLLYEDTMLLLSSDASRAYTYGAKHFDALRYPSLYDVDRAEHLFKRALEFNSSTPLAHHQLGRVAFLRGDFFEALWHINQELVVNPDSSPSTYYMRGLVLGFMERYEEAAPDFEVFLATYPGTWAALNDYAWVLLKAGRGEEAAAAAQKGLEHKPDSPWLLNTTAIALYELGELDQALELAQRALMTASALSKEEWHRAYPGNDPKAAQDGIEALQQSARDNVHTITSALAARAVQ